MAEANWFVVHTYSGYENKVSTNLERKVESLGMGDKIFHIMIPMENEVVADENGNKRVVTRKVFPGYVLVEMNMTSEAYWFIKSVTGVTGFLGDPNPVPLPEEEIAGIVELTDNTSGKPKHVVQFERGESVRITVGPFKHFLGVVEEVNEQKNKLKVMVTVFDRATPVEVDFLQVEKN